MTASQKRQNVSDFTDDFKKNLSIWKSPLKVIEGKNLLWKASTPAIILDFIFDLQRPQAARMF